MPTLSGFTVILGDRVKETTQTTSTGTYSLDGPATGFRTFVAGIGNGNRTVYTVASASSYEIGIGTVTAGAPATISRDSILVSSNSNNAVNWPPGVKDIFADAPAALLSQIFSQPSIPQTFSAISTTSGDDKEFASISSSARHIDIALDAVSASGTNDIALVLGTSSGYETSNYFNRTTHVGSTGTLTHIFSSNNFVIGHNLAAGSALYGIVTLMRIGGTNSWAFKSDVTVGGANQGQVISSGTKTLAGALTRLRVSTDGANTFDGGQVGAYAL